MKVLIVGATSAIASETARAFAEEGAALYLTGRDPARLAALADDLRARGALKVVTDMLDARDVARHLPTVRAAEAALGGLDAALVAHGVLPDQAECERDPEATRRAIEVNFSSAAALLVAIAAALEARGGGCLAAITSVAGDRGRAGNYVYGASKAGLDAFLEGLRGRLHRSGVAVVTAKPGFVDTPMTAHLRKNPLFADARGVGRGIHAAMKARRDVVYLPWFWRPIMAIVRAIPRPIFKRLGL